MPTGSTGTRRHRLTLRVPVPIVRSRSGPETHDRPRLVPENVDTVVGRVRPEDRVASIAQDTGYVGVVGGGSRGGRAVGPVAKPGLGLPDESVLVVVHRVVIHLSRLGRVVVHSDGRRGRGQWRRGRRLRLHQRQLLSASLLLLFLLLVVVVVVVAAETVVLTVVAVPLGVYRLVDVAQLPVHLERAAPRAAPAAPCPRPSLSVPAPSPRQAAPPGAVGDAGVGVERGQKVVEVRVLAGQEAGEAAAGTEAVLLLVRRFSVHRAGHHLRVRGGGVVAVAGRLLRVVVGVGVGGVGQAGVAVVAEGVQRRVIVPPQGRLLAAVALVPPAPRDASVTAGQTEG